MLLWGGLLLSGCGKDSELSCAEDTDCEAGYQCLDERCELKFVECASDDQCEFSYQECSSDGMCIERTSCEDNDQCASGKVCSSGTCVERECRNDTECTDPAQRCREGICQTVARQCATSGGSCDLNGVNNLGFGCADLGSGPRCYNLCETVPVCDEQSGELGTSYDCPANQLCVTTGVAEPVCRPAECGGYFQGQAACAEIAAQDTTRFANGAHCAPAGDSFGNRANLCVPAGRGVAGDPCSTVTNCGTGLVCVNYIPIVGSLNAQSGGFCAPACNSDDQCTGGTACIGDDLGLYAGVGFCGDRCEPYQVGNDQCGGVEGCLPVSSTDGVCFWPDIGEKEMYDSCDPSGSEAGCPSGTICLNLGGGQGRCTPYCDPTAADPDSTCPSPDGKVYLSLMHLAKGYGAVNVYVNGERVAEGFDFGDVADDEGMFIALTPGEVVVEIIVPAATSEDQDAKIFEATLTLAGNSVSNIVLIPETDEESDEILQALILGEPRGLAAPVGESAEVRLVHGLTLAGPVDILALRAGAPFETEGTNELLIVLAENLALGEMTDFVAVGTELGDEETEALYNIYVFEAAAQRDEENAVAMLEGVAFATGDMFTAYISGELVEETILVPDPNDPEATPTEETIEVLAVELVPVPYRSAAKSRVLGGYCYDLAAGESAPRAGLGICLETCTENEHYVTEACSGSGDDACSPVGSGLGWCFPGGTGGQAGDDCLSGDDCANGLYCDPAGEGAGTCRSFCEPNAQETEGLTCAEGETCFASAGYENFGRCRIACEPDANFADDNCPENQKSCYPSNGATFCRPSGFLQAGADCGSPTTQNCVTGTVCAKNGQGFGGMLLEPFSATEAGEIATCRPLCQPFKGNDAQSDCPSDMRCSMIMPGNDFSTELGHCVAAGDITTSTETGDVSNVNKMCGDNAFWLDSSPNACTEGSAICYQFCDFATGSGCYEGTRCQEWSETGALLDVYGICT